MSSAGNRDDKTRDAGDRASVVTDPTDGLARDREPTDVQAGPSPDSRGSGDGEPAALATPPWQRTRASASASGDGRQAPGSSQVSQTIDQDRATEQRPLVTGTSSRVSGGQAGQPAGRMSVNLGSAAATTAAGGSRAGRPSALRRPGRGPRRASLHVKRLDPWSVLKLSLVLAIAMFFVWMVAVGVLYGVLDGMGVWDKLNGTYNDLVSSAGNTGGGPLISAGRVFGVAAIIGVINIILFTALATIGAFVYNVAADLAGGLEVTLAERE